MRAKNLSDFQSPQHLSEWLEEVQEREVLISHTLSGNILRDTVVWRHFEDEHFLREKARGEDALETRIDFESEVDSAKHVLAIDWFD